MIGRRVDVSLGLSAHTLDGLDIYVTAIEGHERISELFRYEVDFLCNVLIHPAVLLGQKATLTIDADGHRHTVHGIVTEFSTGDATSGGDFAYQAVLSPRLGLLDLNRQSVIYGTANPITVSDLVEDVLNHATGTSGIRHERRLRGRYEARSQIVQYAESDLAFVQRQCEHEGIFFFFEHDGQSETVVFGDRNDACKKIDIDGADAVAFNSKRGASRASDHAVTRFRAVSRQVSRQVSLRDYNDTMPTPTLAATSKPVTIPSFGKVIEYGDHFATEEEGKKLATIRAEEFACRGTIYIGESNVPYLRAGTVFTLTHHPFDSKPVQYLVVSARHSVSVPPPSAFAPLPFSHEARSAKPYTNVIECIEFKTPFRPERKTPRPRIPGLVTATIDATEADKARGWIDDKGRYKVRFDFDDGPYRAGDSSEYVRRSQPYLGPNTSGMHFPLVKDTEVVVSYLNGDPDRPIVIGAVANASRPDPVTKKNHTVNRIETAANVRLEIDDRMVQPAGAPTETPFFRVDVPAQVGGRSFTGTYLRLGQAVPSDETALVPMADGTSASGGTPEDGALLYTNEALAVNVAGTATHTYGTGYSTTTTSGSSTHSVKNGDYSLDVGGKIDETARGDINLTCYGNIAIKTNKDGADGSGGDLTENIDGHYTLTVAGDLKKISSASHSSTTYGDYDTLTYGNYHSTTLGINFSTRLTLDFAVNIGIQSKLCIGGEVKASFIQDTKFVAGLNTTIVCGFDVKLVAGNNNQWMSNSFKSVVDADIKFANYDIKRVNVDYKISQANYNKTIVEFVESISMNDRRSFNVAKRMISTNTDDIAAFMSKVLISAG
ncbi:type VI secretion system Vgr family protein [Segnochrobactrum spirostomi]|uniref:Type VI secretion system tip protein VgrG n=1 Tax=Segnochrobactrum spirostomi TaxID=2608987 RepID=A0A6A7XZM2_9HYPH|nr:type VI secretion system tip protein TssI/VgrG [Segnochrobactrum spirostomi]MQT11199.1 type VI secretion system tip protein VgrG [Segnochrobactrum spirostomi]